MRLQRLLLIVASASVLRGAGPATAGEASGKLEYSGDFRLRHESDVDREGQADRHRARVRVRAGGGYHVSEDWTVTAAIRTGASDSPRSPHQTLGNNFDSFSVALDQAFVRFHPVAAKGLAATAGKFPQPFVTTPVYGELQWDADLRPEGLSVAYGDKVGEKAALSFTAARFVLLERGEGSDVGLWAGQVAFKANPEDGVNVTLAVDFHEIDDTEPGGAQQVVARNAGNLLVDRNGDGKADSYASRFRLVHPLMVVQLARFGLGQPLTLSAEMVHNRGAVNQHDNAFAIGASLGQSAKKGDWLVYGQYLKVEQESLFSAFAQDDFAKSTNYRGYVAGVRYMFLDKANLNVWALPSRADNVADADWEWRFRADLNFSL